MTANEYIQTKNILDSEISEILLLFATKMKVMTELS